MFYFVPFGTKLKNVFPVQYSTSSFEDRSAVVKELIDRKLESMLFVEVDDSNFEGLTPVLEFLELDYKVVVGIKDVETLRSFLMVSDYEKVINATSIELSKDSQINSFVDKLQEANAAAEVDIDEEIQE